MKNNKLNCKHNRLIFALFVSALLSVVVSTNVIAVPTLGGASNFAILGLEDGSVIINSATSITGNVGYGKNVTSNTNQKVNTFDGSAYVHSTATFNHTAATFAPTGGILTGSSVDTILNRAVADAISASNTYATYAPIAALGTIGDNDSLTLTSTGTLNVFSMDSLNYKEDVLELVGQTLDDYFIFNILGGFDFSNSEIKLTGVESDHVIFNFLSESDIKINKAGTSFAGTILAPLGNVDYHNPASFDGSIIAKDITLHSDFNISYSATTVTVPESSLPLLLATGLVGMLFAKRHQQSNHKK